ncbi:SusC/RagA family TonB-linked outer membrane protein [Mangrovimonas spongiae]|uniref:SusC/RagA family TonB-linked outer membrane protein n=1 Tax=Mangrovimonas spongiae TaxID=2494697 RepID=A0A428K6H2_9FLAO|nr:SusC/RagA family TonB-linked outer membrane protein [Mangrovimonas spongiae]RSK42078.1 SusC/RagA family TonB-linked outer membrane protein [Mangrovimonas spongiae]
MKTKFSGILTLFLAFVVQLSFAQEKQISGTISDENGLPLPGVNVIVKGTTNGTQTDFDGNYSITANQGDVLSYSFVGYATKEMTVGASNTMSFAMDPDVQAIDEVVITALGIKREKKEIAYQAEAIESEKLSTVNPTTAAQGLVGKISGLQINVQDNGVNPSSQILLRGLRSIGQNNSALIVIDGSRATQGAFDDLNPNDIENINVLKGSTAAALYGSDAANGALIVTTKRGKENSKFTVGVRSTTTFTQVAYMPDFQTEYGTGWQGDYDPIENTNWGPRFDGVPRQVGPTFDDGTYQTLPYAPVDDNLLNFYQTGVNLQNNVYFTGGGKNSSFYMSLGHQDTEGIIKNDDYERTTVRVNASQRLGNLELSLNSSFFRDNTNVVGSTIGSQDRPLYWFVLNTPANIPLENYQDWRNDLYASPDGYFNGYYQNPYWAIDTNRNTDRTNRLNGNIQASWDVADWLNITGRFSLNRATGTGKNWRAEQNYTGAYTRPDAVSSFVTDSEFQSTIYTSDLLATGNFTLFEDFSLKTILGATSYNQRYRQSSITANNLSILGFYDISNGTGELQGTVDEQEKRTYGFFADVTLGYRDFIYLNASGRQDYTSTLNPDDNSYFYPAIGLSFVVSEAFPSIKEGPIDLLKISANNSTVYNDLPIYQINERYAQSGSFPFGTINGFFAPGTFVDPDIKKEKINSTEINLNLSMFTGRLTLDGSYAKTMITDNIVNTTPSVASGGTNFLTNIGELENNAFDFTLAGDILRSDNGLNWNSALTFSSAETTVNKIGNGVTSVNLGSNIYAIEGEVFPQIQATSYVRDPQGRIVVDATNGRPLIGDLKPLGKTTPDYVIGWTNSLSYKGFNLSGTLDYRTGHVYYSQLADAMEFTGRSVESVSTNRQDFVMPNSVINVGTAENPQYVANNNIPVTGGRQSYWTDTYNDIKENYVRDATAVKLREIALSYDLPSKLIENLKLSKVSIGVVGRNLITWLPEENRFSDPEFNNTNSNAIGTGGYFQSPPTRSYGFNVNIEF